MARKPSAKPLGIVAEIKASPVKKTSGRGWFDRLKEGEAKDDLRDLHRKKKAGEMEGYSHKIIREAILFMRKKSLEAHVGGGIIKATQDPDTGAIIACRIEFFQYFNAGYHNNRWSSAGSVNLVPRGA